MKAPNPSKEEIGSSSPEKLTVGRMVMIHVPKIAAVWLLVKDETSIPIEVDAITNNIVPTKRVRKLPLTGTSKMSDCHSNQQNKIYQSKEYIRDLLADQKLKTRDWRDIEVNNRAKFFFSHNSQRTENCRNDHQENCNGCRNHGSSHF